MRIKYYPKWHLVLRISDWSNISHEFLIELQFFESSMNMLPWSIQMTKYDEHASIFGRY